MAKRSKMTFEKRRREMEKKKKRAEKLERKHDDSEDTEPQEIPDPLDMFREYEEEVGIIRDRPDESEPSSG